MATNQRTIVPLRNLEVGKSYKLREQTQLVPTITLMTQDQNHFNSLHNQFHELIFRTDTSDLSPFFQFQPSIGDEADAYMVFDPESFPNGLDTEFILYFPSAAPMATTTLNVPTPHGGKRKYTKSQKRRKSKLSKKRHLRNR